MQLDEYLWCVIVGGIFCFTLGFGMGANDVSNNFGTSVGAKSISLKHAILIAAIFELVGSVGLGAQVTDSVRKGVYYPEKFGDMPDLLLMANLTAMVTCTIWLISASHFGLPVSTTHSLIGALMGCGLGISWNAVNWKFIGMVVASWFVAPILSSAVGIVYWIALRQFILRSPNSVKKGLKYLWLLVFLICVVCALFFAFNNPFVLPNTSCVQKDSDGNLVSSSPCFMSKWIKANIGIAVGIAFAGGIVLAVLLVPLVYWRAKRKLRKFDQEVNNVVVVADQEKEEEGRANSVSLPPRSYSNRSVINSFVESVAAKSNHASSTQASLHIDAPEEAPIGCRGKCRKVLDNMPWNADLHAQVFDHDSKAEEMADSSEKFDPRCEVFFMTLQIISAAISCLVHGSNDVANAAAPFASLYSIFREGQFLKSISVPIWILFLGGAAISVGLTFMGSKVIGRLGIQLLHVSPSRGFIIEMASSSVMIVASFIGLPLSTTHVTVGAMIGVGLCDRHFDPETGEEVRGKRFLGLNFNAINWRVVKTIAFAWVGTLLVCAGASYLIFSFAINSPTRVQTRYEPCTSEMWGDNHCRPNVEESIDLLLSKFIQPRFY